VYSPEDTKVIHETEDWCLELEYNRKLGIFLLHQKVYRWSHSVLKRALHDWEVVRSVLFALGVNEIYVPGMAAKYARIFGFKDTGIKIVYENGNIEELQKWERSEQ
jgi:hypothetical protein